MLNIPDTIKSLFERDDIHKNFRVHFPNGEFPDITNENIVEESVKFTESFCSQNNFRFGLAESSVLEFETVGAGNMFGMTIDASMEIDTSTLTAAELDEIEAGSYDGELIRAGVSDLGFGVYRVPYGRFFVESCPRNHQAMAHRNIVAYSVAQVDRYNMGQVPATKISFDIATMRETLNTSADGYTPAREPVDVFAKRRIIIATKTTGRLYLGHRPITSAEPPGAALYTRRFRYSMPQTQAETSINTEIVLNVQYKKDNIFDERHEIIDEVCAAAPAGFGPGGNTARDIMTHLNLATPAYYIETSIQNRTTSAVKSVKTLPKAITNPGKVPITLKNEIDSTTLKAIALGTNEYIGSAVVVVDIPYFLAATSDLVKIEEYVFSGDEEVYKQTYYPRNWPVTEDYYRAEWENITVEGKNITPLGVTLNYSSEVLTDNPGQLPYYDYSETIDTAQFENADFELTGSFGKIKRTTGKFERASLDASDPVEISPANYSELWWDEYEIARIGNVYINSEKLGGAVVSIGSGQSYYDMSDNKIIADHADATSMPGIAETILNEFAPATENCYFTPAEITLHGAPWIEAGDALRITAEDETTVETFALRHTISGIQNLVSAIEATSGRIIGVEA